MKEKSSIIKIPILLIAIVVVIALFMGALTLVDSIGIFKPLGPISSHMWVGAILFMFLSIEGKLTKRDVFWYTPSAIGGILTAYLLTEPVADLMGSVSMIAFFTILIVAIVGLIEKKLPIMFNHCFMLFMTICTIPQLAHGSAVYHLNYCVVIVVAMLFFGALLHLKDMGGKKKSAVN